MAKSIWDKLNIWCTGNEYCCEGWKEKELIDQAGTNLGFEYIVMSAYNGELTLAQKKAVEDEIIKMRLKDG